MMTRTHFLIALVSSLAFLSIASSRLTSEQYGAYQKGLDSQVKSQSLENLNDVYYKVINLLENGKKSASEIISKDNICAYLKKVGYSKAYEADLGYQFNYLLRTFGCPATELKSEYNSLLKSAQKGEKLEDIHVAVKLAESDNEYNKTEIKEACTKVFDLIKDDGSGTTKSSKRATESSLLNTAKALEIVQACKKLKLVDTKNQKKLDQVLTHVQSNLRLLRPGVSAFIEGDFFVATASLISSIQALSPQTFTNSDLAQLAGYLRSQEEAAETPERNYLFYRAARALDQVPVATLETQTLSKGKSSVVRAKVTNILGEEIAQGRTLKVTGNLYGKEAKDTTTVIASGIVFEKKANGVYEAQLKDSENLRPGLYPLSIVLSENKNQYEYVGNIIVKGVSDVRSVRFGVTKSKEVSETPLENSYERGTPATTTLQANQGNFIHIEFKVAQGTPKPNFAGARLVNSEYRFASGTVAAKFERENNMYRIIIDLGDPDHILPYPGTYQLELILSGEVIETIRWNLAKVNVAFVKPATGAPATDANITLLPEIHHQFPGDRRKPNTLITTFFDLLIPAALVGFFFILTRLQVNWNRFPSGFGSLTSLAFLGLILALIGTLALFWIKINIFETLLLLSILSIPTVIVGNIALRSINAKTV